MLETITLELADFSCNTFLEIESVMARLRLLVIQSAITRVKVFSIKLKLDAFAKDSNTSYA